MGMLIDLFCSDLVTGYKELKIARQALLKKWRAELLRAYTKAWDRYTQQLAAQEARKQRYEGFLPIIGVLLLLVCSIGAWLTFRRIDLVCLGMLLMLGTGFGALLALLPWFALTRTPPPPENPVTHTSDNESESPLRQRLFPELVPLWRREMALRIPSEQEVLRMADETGKWGLIGEFDLIRELERIVSPDTYILHSLKPKPGDDMDVVVIGPKGIWYFEVKHWNAHFTWQAGAWQVWQLDYETRTPRPVPMRETPDAQWARMRSEALEILKASGGSASESLKKVPVKGDIQGGIVFSNPNASIEIDRLAPFRYGTIEQWIAIYQAAPRLKDMTPGRALEMLETLLEQHQSFYPDSELHSMKDSVAKVIAQVEQGIQGWIDSA
jgi:hypothetical protein